MPLRKRQEVQALLGGAARTPPVHPIPAREGEYLRLYVSLPGARRPVWRRFLLRADASFLELHGAIQALGWTDLHLWRFVDAASRRVLAGIQNDHWFREPDPDASAVRVDAVLRAPGDRCVYVYDFGDDWRHDVVLEGVETREERFDRALLDGAGAFPPEDCGGIGGFERLREFLETGEDPWGDAAVLAEWTEGMTLEEPDMARERQRFGAVVEGELPAPHELEPTPPPAGRVRELDEPTIRSMVGETNEFLAGLGERLGLEIALHRTSYSAINARIEIAVSTVRDDGLVMDRHAEEFLRRRGEFGLEHDDLGREFDCEGHSYRIIGLRPRANLPVVCELVRCNESGGAARPVNGRQRMRMSAAAVRGLLEPRGGDGPELHLQKR